MKKISLALNRKTVGLFSLLAFVAASAIGFHIFQGEILDQMPAKSESEKGLPPEVLRQQPRVIIENEINALSPPSPWVEAEKKRYLAALVATKPVVIVLPFQIPEGKGQFGIDLPARMVMTYMTAQRIASGTDLKVADVEFVARALGEPRHITREEAIGLGRTIGAKTVVYGEAFHDGAGHLTAKLASLHFVPSTTEIKSWTKSGIDISDEVTPELAYHGLVDEAVQQSGFEDSKVLDAKPVVASNGALSSTPLSAMSGISGNSADGIWMQELLGSIYPEDPARARDRVFERALAGIEYLSQSAPDYRLLKARALARLGRRLAALSTIRDYARTPEEQAFVGFLNGNVPEMEKAVAQIRRPLPRLIAELELAWVDSLYSIGNNKLPQVAERIAKTVPKEWAPGIIWFVTGQNLWNLSQTMPVKLVMDAHFPVNGYAANDVLQGKAVVGGGDRKVMLEIEGAPLTHAGKVLEQSGADWCCEAQAWKPRPYQYLDLLAAHAESMLIRDVDHTSYVQGKNDEAIQLADMIDEVVFLRGNFIMQLRKARFMMVAINNTPSPQKNAGAAEQLYQTSRRLRQWNNFYPELATEIANYESATAQDHFAPLLKQKVGMSYPDTNNFKRDLPSKYDALITSPEYVSAVYNMNGDLSVLERTCMHSLIVPDSCEAWRSRLEATGQADAARKVEKEQIVERFRGHPKRTEILIAALKKRGEIDGAAALARENIRLKSDAWEGYYALGDIYLEGGKFKEAADAYLAYPVFRNPGTENTVGVTNSAGNAAYQLARRGAVKEAQPLLEVAARYNNGSESSLAAMMSLAYRDRRYGDAEFIARERVQHYADGPSIRAYLSLLFALGDSQSAWAGIAEALPRVSGFSQWRTVPVGFRIDGADVEAVRKWAKGYAAAQDPRMPPAMNARPLQALTVAIQTLAMDKPIASLEALPGFSKDLVPEPVFAEPNFDKMQPEQREALKKSREAARAAAEKARRARPGVWKDYLDRLIAGYLAFKRGDYKASWDAFQVHSAPSLYDEGFDASYTGLPYHAYAAVKAGQAEAFSAYLEKWAKIQVPASKDGYAMPKPFPEFDVHLARAVLVAAEGKHADAKKELLLARATLAEPGIRPLPPEYVFAEVCELLAADSGTRDYLDIAVDWAKAYQVYEPWAAWAYAFEAKYGKANTDRAKALAIAQYLDRNSVRISDLDAVIVNQAKAWLVANKPFPRERRAQNQKAL